MRGTPIWQVIGVMLMFAAAGLPVLRLTNPAALPPAAVTPLLTNPVTRGTPIDIHVSFSRAPSDFVLRYLGATAVLSGHEPTEDFTGTWIVQLPADGVDLTLQAHWPESTAGHVAAHITVRLPDGRETTQTFWRDAGQSMIETLTIKP